MKKCNMCSTLLDDEVSFCVNCGSSDLSDASTPEAPVAAAPAEAKPEPVGNGNIVAGAVGAFLFALLGGVLYFLFYQMGIIAGICGLVIFALANFGYSLFAKSGKNCVAGIISSVVAMIVMIFLAEYLCLSYEILQVAQDWGVDITFFEAVRATPEFLADSEVSAAMVEDLIFAYAFGVIACISYIINLVKERKKSK